MKFKYSAIGDNTQENREWLEKLGYKPNMISEKDNMLYTREYVNGWMYSGCPYMNIPDSYINCLGNPRLFQAVTAIREDSDSWQWYTDGKIWMFIRVKECFELYLYNDVFGKDYKNWHKASLTELKEHFKVEH